MPARVISSILLSAASMTADLRAQAEPEVSPGERLEELDPAVLELVQGSVATVRAAPESAVAWGRLCMAFEANLLWPEAVECYRTVSQLEPWEATWQLQEAIVRIEIGDVGEALSLLEAVVGKAPELLAASERLGYLLLEHGELEASLALFEALIERLPDRAAGYVGAGEVELLRERFERAAEHLERAVMLEPLAPAAHYQLGLAYRALGRTEEAERELTVGAGGERRYLATPLAREIASYSVYIGAEVEQAGDLLQTGRSAEAAEILERVLERSPENPMLLNDLAIAYMKQGRLVEAGSLLDRALAQDERNFSTYLNLSALASYSGQTTEAVDAARAAVGIAPGVAETHLALARALGDPRLEAAGQPAPRRAEMLAELERAIEIGVDSPDAYLQLARERWRSAELEEAFSALDSALERWPDFWPGELMRTWILVRSERFPEAVEVLERVRAMAPDHPDIATLERMIGEAGAGDES